MQRLLWASGGGGATFTTAFIGFKDVFKKIIISAPFWGKFPRPIQQTWRSTMQLFLSRAWLERRRRVEARLRYISLPRLTPKIAGEKKNHLLFRTSHVPLTRYVRRQVKAGKRGEWCSLSIWLQKDASCSPSAWKLPKPSTPPPRLQDKHLHAHHRSPDKGNRERQNKYSNFCAAIDSLCPRAKICGHFFFSFAPTLCG